MESSTPALPNRTGPYGFPPRRACRVVLAVLALAALLALGACRDDEIADKIPGGENGGGMPSLSLSDVQQNEGYSGSSIMAFTVSLSATSNSDVSALYATSDGTATVADNDYATGTGTLVIVAGAVTGTIDVPVSGDNVYEQDETLQVTLSNPIGAVIGDGVGVGTIVNDDTGIEPTTAQVFDAFTIHDPSGRMAIADRIILTLPGDSPESGYPALNVWFSPDGKTATAQIPVTLFPGTYYVTVHAGDPLINPPLFNALALMVL